MLEIEQLLHRTPRQLSGGQRQRVAMGRAIVRDPKLFLFDEPLSNLDAKLRVQMRTELRKLRVAVPTTTIYVTHDQVEAMTLADRIVILNHGRIEQIGTPEEVYRDAGLGFCRQLHRRAGDEPAAGAAGARPGDAGGWHARSPMAAARACRAMARRRCCVAVRPEELGLGAAGRLADGACLRGTALTVEPLGADTLVTLLVARHRDRLPPAAAQRPTRGRGIDADARSGATASVRSRQRTALVRNGKGRTHA